MKKTLLFILIAAIIVLTLGLKVVATEEGSNSSVSSISILSYPTRTVYGAFEQLDTSGLSLRVIFTDGSERVVLGDEIRISYARDNCFRVGDDSVLLSYGGKSLYLPVTVNRIAYDISSLDLDGFSVVYNGTYQTYNRPTPQIVGLDGIPLGVNISGGGVGVGIYDVSIDFSTESKDYLIPESRIVSMTVLPASAQVVWEDTSFVYDGRSKAPVAYYTDVLGKKNYLTVSGASTNAGSGYTAKVTTTDPNYMFTNTVTEFEIKKADFDFSSVVWSKDSFIYDGSKKSISASGLPSGVSIIGYSGDRGTDAGSYTVTAMLSWDERNYNMPPSLTHVWEIKKADYDISNISFKNESFVFDGKMHYPTLIGTMPVGADGILLEYSFSSGAAHVSDGKVSVVISFHTDSKNYNVPPDKYSSVSITPRGIYVEWGETSLYYNGENQIPSAYAEECVIKLSGGATNAGKYVAVAGSDNSDYYVINDRREYSILQAENYWKVFAEDSICYEGRNIALTGESRFGEISVEFFADKEATQRISVPTACGKYYAILSVEETENYTSLVSEVISFEIVEVVAISFRVQIIREELTAFEIIGNDDFYCEVINNDGSIDKVAQSLVRVIYENGDSLRRGDSTVQFEYGEFILILPVEIGYADYDLSGVRWTNEIQVYDGTAKLPTLEGLPDGVRVLEYLSPDTTDAGCYKVYVTLEYDRENYNEPQIPYCDFTIEKRLIKPTVITSVYNGKGQMAISTSPLYSVISSGEYTDSGVYNILLELTDSNNYTFGEDSGDRTYGLFEITPAIISVSVSDVRLRLFEELSDVDYVITVGTLYGNDILTVSPYAEGKRVLLRSLNPNYSLDVTSGRIIRLPYPTLHGALIILSSILLVLMMLLTVLTALRNRHRIISAVAMLRCRWHNRRYKAPMPKTEAEENTDPPTEEISIAESFDMEIDEIETTTFSEGEEKEDEEEKEEVEESYIIDFEIDAERADKLITDSLAKSLINREGEIIYTSGSEKEIINLGDINANFLSGERVDVNSLKKKGLISLDTAYIKVLGGGSIDKPLMVYANDFSLSAVKMIALTGGKVTKVVTFKERGRDEKE